MLFCNRHEVEGIKLYHIVLVYLIGKGFVNVKPPKSCQQTIQICAWNTKEKEVLAFQVLVVLKCGGRILHTSLVFRRKKLQQFSITIYRVNCFKKGNREKLKYI